MRWRIDIYKRQFCHNTKGNYMKAIPENRTNEIPLDHAKDLDEAFDAGFTCEQDYIDWLLDEGGDMA